MINEQCCIVGILTSLIHPKILCLRWRWMPSFLRQWFSKFRVWVIFLAVTFLSLCDFSCFHTKPFKYFSKLREGPKKYQVEKRIDADIRHRPHRSWRVHIGKNISSVTFSMTRKEVKKPAGQNGSWEKHGLVRLVEIIVRISNSSGLWACRPYNLCIWKVYRLTSHLD